MKKISKPFIVHKLKDGTFKLQSGAIVSKEQLDKLLKITPVEQLVILVDYSKKDFNAETGESEK
jgi:hypothetical protein